MRHRYHQYACIHCTCTIEILESVYIEEMCLQCTKSVAWFENIPENAVRHHFQRPSLEPRYHIVGPCADHQHTDHGATTEDGYLSD